jgi:sulfite dehydrogenase (cytochrome) subunit B
MRNAIILAAACLGALSAASTGAKDIQLPPDTVQLTPSPLPGYAKAQANCTMCHSAEYMLYQPPSAARPYWDAMVHRMKTVFKAPIADEDMPAIVDYLAATYGNQKPK